MKRRLFTVLAALSLLLCVATVVMWVRSHIVVDKIDYTRSDGTKCYVSSSSGAIVFGTYLERISEPKVLIGNIELHGFTSDISVVKRKIYYVTLVFAFGTIPFLWLLAWAIRREHRILNPLLCRNCGYDLRATPDRCPECGAVPDFGLRRAQSSRELPSV